MKTISIIDQFQSRCKFKYSENQIGIFSEILDDRRRSILLNSVAGSGKSTTIVESLNFISPYELTILLAFNKDIVRELEGKVPSHVKVATLNSWGMKELRFHFGNITLDESKVSKIIDRLIPTWGIDSFDNMRNLLPNTVELPLSVSYRSGVKIIQHAQSLVSHIMPSPTAIEGEVKIGSFKEIQDGDFVLCRNTRPLVALCMKFISEGHKATIKGGDIGKNLINMIKKTKAKTQDALFKKLDADHLKLVEKSKALYPNKDVEKISTVVNMSDKIEALRTISLTAKSKSTDEIINIINAIFVDDAKGIIFSTMHKSKGLEADNVFIIEAQLCPAFYAMKDWQLNQEYNLMYVARTRAKKKLVYVNDWLSDMTKMPFLNKAIAELNIKN